MQLGESEFKSKKRIPFYTRYKLLHDHQNENFHINAFQQIRDPDNKLRTYSPRNFPTEVGLEKYLLEVKNINSRQALTKFRLSNHTLNIERGRYTSPKTPKEERYCPFCPSEVEDEVHFLLTCPTYQIPRKEMLKSVSLINPSSCEYSQNKQFLELMKTENANLTSKFIMNIFEIRQFLSAKPRRPI